MSSETYVGDAGTPAAAVRLPRGSTAAGVAASASLLAAAVHLVTVPEHLARGWVPAAFLAVVALAQALLAWAVLRRPTVPTVMLGLCGTVAVVLAYVASRTVGVPITSGGDTAAHSAHTGGLLHQPIAGTIGPGVPVMPGLEGNPGLMAVGALDLFALMAELGAVMALLAMLPTRQRSLAANVLVLLGAALWAAALL